MPLPAKLPVRLAVKFTDQVLAEVRAGLAKAGTTCEYMGRCTSLATVPYRTDWTVAYLCDEHRAYLLGQPQRMRLNLERQLSEFRMDNWLVFSYVHTNNQSGYVLEKIIEQQRREDKGVARAKTKQAAATRGEIKRSLREQQTRIGAPDEELLTARERNLARVADGKKPLGPKPVTPRTKSADHSEAYQSLPFPEFSFI